ncbi:pirin family protein [Arthrobacter crusticola]|uniref:Pirin family protein n=1 Tax=Arthrobacter crusticola TaxID=2547960 RepID=A0A4R5TUX6_9MICC|nr:pirin family protein [Arthrobacter crusticola]TDK24857.1 pirin family protein [Arthrobacter crusticola]
MSNLELDPTPVVCSSGDDARGRVDILQPREVPLGGPRAMGVRRTLPQRNRSLIGAWCFLDHYGPEPVSDAGGMSVPPHPHTGLQTVSWLFAGEIEHRDSAANHAFIRPGELNLMTAGSGISHSEVATSAAPVMHGVQLWLALPDAFRHTERGFEHYAPEPVSGDGYTLSVFLGSFGGSTSPVTTYSPLLGAELQFAAGRSVTFDVFPEFEHGILLDSGSLEVNGTPVTAGELAYLAPGGTAVEITATADGPARLLVIGGEPFGEDIVMWWNFVGRTHEEIVKFRAAWTAEVEPGMAPADGAPRFGLPEEHGLRPLPAPVLPNSRLRPRQGDGGRRNR